MPADSWFARRLRAGVARTMSRGQLLPQPLAPSSSMVVSSSSGSTHSTGVNRRFVVCGDDQLAFRLIEELTVRYAADVTVIMPSRRVNHGPQIARLAGVRVIEADRLDVVTFRQARLAGAEALALVAQDDVGNIHAALQAQDVNADIRLVLRMFNMSLGHRVGRLFTDCSVLSDAAMAVPSFVSAALGEQAPAFARVYGKTLYVARCDEVGTKDIVCGLARTDDAGQVELLPNHPSGADLVLAVASGVSGVIGASGVSDANGVSGDDRPETEPAGRRRRLLALRRNWLRAKRGRGRSARRRIRPLATMRALVSRKLRLALLSVLALLVLGTAGLAYEMHLHWWDAAYLALLTEFGATDPEVKAGLAQKAIQAMLTVVSIAIVPVATAAVVDAVVNIRLAGALGQLPTPVSDHIVVVGLGNVGTRVIRRLHELGVPVVAVDRSETARGAELARRLGIPLVIGDSVREEILREASVETARALLCLTTDDDANLETGLYARGLKEELRVVLRLFDADFAARVQRAFGVTISRSVSHLAAPAFAAAMVEREVIGTIPVDHRLLVVAEAPVCAGSALDGRPVSAVEAIGPVRVIAVRVNQGKMTLWCPPASYVLCSGDRLTVVTNRQGLSSVLAATGQPIGPGGADETAAERQRTAVERARTTAERPRTATEPRRAAGTDEQKGRA